MPLLVEPSLLLALLLEIGEFPSGLPSQNSFNFDGTVTGDSFVRQPITMGRQESKNVNRFIGGHGEGGKDRNVRNLKVK